MSAEPQLAPRPPAAAARAALDLDAYCRRIGYAGPRRPTWPVLRAVHRAHASAIPFENLDVLAGRRISIRLADVQQKLVDDHRGGYCFEHSTLMLEALRALGFDAQPLIGRVRWQVPAHVPTNQGHMRLRVRCEGRDYLADAGLGSTTLLEPIRLEVGTDQANPLDRRRLLEVGPDLLEQVNFGRGWCDVCLFGPQPAPPPDFELGNWYYCTHPDSLFIRNLVVARTTPEGRYSLFNREFAFRPVAGPGVKETVADPARLAEVLAEHFGLDGTEGAALAAPELHWD